MELITNHHQIMNTSINKEFGLLGNLFTWIDRHPRAAAVLLWLMVAALIYVVFTYNFTIPAYK